MLLIQSCWTVTGGVRRVKRCVWLFAQDWARLVGGRFNGDSRPWGQCGPWVQHLMLMPPTAILLRQMRLVASWRKYVCRTSSWPKWMNHQSSTRLLFCHFTHLFSAFWGLIKKIGFKCEALGKDYLVLRSFTVYFCSSFLRNNCTQQEHQDILNVFHLVEFACKSGLILKRHSVKNEMPFACHFTLTPLYFCFLLKRTLLEVVYI